MGKQVLVVICIAALLATGVAPLMAKDQEVCLDSLTTDEYFVLIEPADNRPFVGRWVNPYGCDDSVVSVSTVQLPDGTVRLSFLVVPYPNGCNPIFIETMAGDADFNLSGHWYNAPFTETGGPEQFTRIDCSLVPNSSSAVVKTESRYKKAAKLAPGQKQR